MTQMILRKLAANWQGPAITVNIGERVTQLGEGIPEAQVVVRNPAVMRRFLMSPSLAFGEAYMDGDIEIEGDLLAILEGFHRGEGLMGSVGKYWQRLVDRMPISVGRARANAQSHYDIGNDFYQLWLDPSRTYSCAYFEHGNETIEEAQFKKRELICQKLRLEPGMTLLDIGAGWGALILHAAEHYGVTATGITPAREQAAFIRAEAQRRGLTDNITVIEDDWRSLVGQFDRVVSVGMFEHVGRQQYVAFLQLWRKLLKPDGVSLLHTIGHRNRGGSDPWVEKYIFPGGYLPTLNEIIQPAAAANLRTYRVENLRPHYAETLAAWAEAFEAAHEQAKTMFDERFIRMWRLYLKGSEAGFRWGNLELYQLELYPKEQQLPLNRVLHPVNRET